MSHEQSESPPAPGPVTERIRAKLNAALSPEVLHVVNESFMHKVAPGSETHFRVVVVSEDFRDKSRVARHRMVHSVLAHELATGVHALAVETYLSEQWRARQEKMQASPPCLGGSDSEV